MEWKCRPLERVRPSSRNTPSHPLSFSLIFLAPHSHTCKYTHPAKMTLSAHPNTLCYTLALLRIHGIISNTENQRSWVWLCLWASVLLYCKIHYWVPHTHTHTHIQKSNLPEIKSGNDITRLNIQVFMEANQFLVNSTFRSIIEGGG